MLKSKWGSNDELSDVKNSMNTTNLIKTIPLAMALVGLLVGAQYAYAKMTPAQDGREQGISDAFSEAHDAGAACSKYQTNINVDTPASTQCYHAYDLAFNQTCLAHPTLMKYRDSEPEYPYCYAVFHPNVNVTAQDLPNSYHDGYRYAMKDWDQHTNNKNYSCPLSQEYWKSPFCKGYDSGIAYEKSS